jgi:hypothetical protein
LGHRRLKQPPGARSAPARRPEHAKVLLCTPHYSRYGVRSMSNYMILRNAFGTAAVLCLPQQGDAYYAIIQPQESLLRSCHQDTAPFTEHQASYLTRPEPMTSESQTSRRILSSSLRHLFIVFGKVERVQQQYCRR